MQDLSSQKNSYTIKRKKKERNQDRLQMEMNQKDFDIQSSEYFKSHVYVPV